MYACAHACGPRDTGRGLHSVKLFRVLQSLETITALGVAEILGCVQRTAQVYAIASEIASRAITPMAFAGLRTEDAESEVNAVPDLMDVEQDF